MANNYVMNAPTKHEKEYGAKNKKANKDPKSSNSFQKKAISIREDRLQLTSKEIDRNLNMLTSCIRTNQVSKTIAVLKILLNHFLKISMNRDNSISSLSSHHHSKYSSTSNYKITQKRGEALAQSRDYKDDDCSISVSEILKN